MLIIKACSLMKPTATDTSICSTDQSMFTTGQIRSLVVTFRELLEKDWISVNSV